MELHNCTNTSSINMSTEDYLQSLQDKANKMMAPAVTFLIILALVGLIGNSLVLVVYWKKFHLNPTKVLIMTIAGVDLVANTGAIPMELSVMFQYWTLEGGTLCRVKVFINVFTTVGGGLALLVVAVVRYRKVCVTFGWQVTLRQSKLLSAVATFLAGILSVPYTVLYGPMSKPAPCYNIKGFECYIDDIFVDTVWPLLNNVLFVLLYLSAVIPLVVLYILIGVKATRRGDVQRICHDRSAPKHQHNPSTKPRCSSIREQVAPDVSQLNSKRQTPVDSVATSKVPDAVSDEEDCRCCTENDKQSSNLTNTSTSLTSSRNDITEDTSECVSSEVEMRATSKPESRKFLMTCLKMNAPCVTQNTNPVASEIIDVTVDEEDQHKKFDDPDEETLKRDSPKPAPSAIFEKRNCFYDVAKGGHLNKEKNVKKSDLKQQKISETKQTKYDTNKNNRRALGHTTAMLITISATFALGYLSFLILSIFRDAFPQKFADLSMAELSFYHLFLRFYFLNSAANPVIYGLCDRKFRRECLNLFRRKPQRNL